MTAGPPKGKGRVLFPSDPVEAIQDSVQRICFDLEILVVGFFLSLRIETKDLEFDKHHAPLFEN
jgi:hypothetical protein